MKVTWKSVAAALVILVIFNAANILAGVMVLGALLLGRTRYAHDVVHTMDCLAAAQIGYDGRKTISKECGLQHPRGSFCRRICRWLDWADEGHCDKEAT